jgi:integrase
VADCEGQEFHLRAAYGMDDALVAGVKGAKLHLERRKRDLALFNLAIDSKLRGCDLVALRVDDVAPNGYAVDRANVRKRKTVRPVRFELTEITRQALDDYLRCGDRKQGQRLFPAGAALASI